MCEGKLIALAVDLPGESACDQGRSEAIEALCSADSARDSECSQHYNERTKNGCNAHEQNLHQRSSTATASQTDFRCVESGGVGLKNNEIQTVIPAKAGIAGGFPSRIRMGGWRMGGWAWKIGPIGQRDLDGDDH